MATIQNLYTGNGSTTNYSFSFEYLTSSHVKVSLDGVDTTAFTFANATTISFNTAPTSGQAIRIYRSTPFDSPSSTFFPGSSIKAEDLNSNFDQSLYVIQEATFDTSQSAIDSAAARTSADAANTKADTAISTANTATTTANAASTSATQASTDAAQAVTAASAAQTSAAAAASSAADALQAANSAAAFQSTANVAAIPGSPANNDRIKVLDSTGIGSFTPLTGLPVGPTYNSGLTVKLIYDSAQSSWVFVEYVANDSDDRYAKVADVPTNNSQLTNGAGYLTNVPDGSVTETKLATNSVTSAKLANNSVTPAKLDRSYLESTAANTVSTLTASSLTSTGNLTFSGLLAGKNSGGTDEINMQDGDAWFKNKVNIGPVLSLTDDNGNFYSVASDDYAGWFESTANRYAAYFNQYGYTGAGAAYTIYTRTQQNSSKASGAVLSYSINNTVYGLLAYWSGSLYYSFYGNGAVAATSFTNVSDKRLKDFQGSPENCLDKLSTLSGYYYTWKENSQELRANGPSVNLGLSAQEVQQVFPEVISENLHHEIAGENPETLNEQLGTTLSVDYGKLVPALIEAIKELKVKVENLEAAQQ